MKLRFTRRAVGDLQSIQQYLLERSRSGAANIGAAIERATENICAFPRGGRLTGYENVRVLPVGDYPYLIYWEIHADEIRIVHIRHAARLPWAGKSESR